MRQQQQSLDRLWVLNRGPLTGLPQLSCYVCDSPLEHGDFSFVPPGPTLVVCMECNTAAEFAAAAANTLMDLLGQHARRASKALSN